MDEAIAKGKLTEGAMQELHDADQKVGRKGEERGGGRVTRTSCQGGPPLTMTWSK